MGCPPVHDTLHRRPPYALEMGGHTWVLVGKVSPVTGVPPFLADRPALAPKCGNLNVRQLTLIDVASNCRIVEARCSSRSA
jgi:hypothetical protein